MRTRSRPVLLAVAVAALAVVVLLWRGGTGDAHAPRAAARSSTSSVAYADLPAQARTTLRLIDSGGPFPYPRNDGVVFGNYEGVLPQQARGYYHEYTVPTPGERSRGARRIVTGGELAAPVTFYYTADHYRTFRRITGVPR